MLILEAINLKKYYGDKLIISIDDLKIQSGDKIGVVGENGAGKTTFLDILSGKINADIGTIKRYSPMAYIKQFLDENIEGGGKIFKEFGVQNKLNSQNVSGGERTKLNIAVELSKNSGLLLVDEPTNYLDTNSIEALEDFLKEYEGTVLFVSHDRAFINSTADRLLILKDRKITEFEGNLKKFEENKKVSQNQGNIYLQKSILQMKLIEIVSKMSLKNCDKDDLEEKYESIVKELNSL